VIERNDLVIADAERPSPLRREGRTHSRDHLPKTFHEAALLARQPFAASASPASGLRYLSGASC
jgi:hypothetical protein